MERQSQSTKIMHRGHYHLQRDIASPLFLGGAISFALSALVMTVYSFTLWPSLQGTASWLYSVMQYDIMLIDELLAFAYLVCRALPFVLIVASLLQFSMAVVLLLMQRNAMQRKMTIFFKALRYILLTQMALEGALLTVVSVILLCLAFGTAPSFGTIYVMGLLIVLVLLLLLGGITVFYQVGLYQMLGEMQRITLEEEETFKVRRRVYYINLVLAALVVFMPLITPPIINAALSAVMNSSFGSALQGVLGETMLSVGWNFYLSAGGVLYGLFLCVLSLFFKVHRKTKRKRKNRSSI